MTAAASPSPRQTSRILLWLLCVIYGAVFVYAGVLKLSNPMTFLDDIRSFRILPDPFAAWLALGLPWLEILAGLAVITGVLRSGGLVCLNVLLVVFLLAILSAMGRGLELSCGCFGSSDQVSDYTQLIVRDLVLLVMGFVAWWLLLREEFDREPPLSE